MSDEIYANVRTWAAEKAKYTRELTVLRKQVAELRAVLAPFAGEVAGGNLQCHRGICPPDECARCRRILMAQRVLAATQPQEVQS